MLSLLEGKGVSLNCLVGEVKLSTQLVWVGKVFNLLTEKVVTVTWLDGDKVFLIMVLVWMFLASTTLKVRGREGMDWGQDEGVLWLEVRGLFIRFLVGVRLLWNDLVLHFGHVGLVALAS